MSEFLKIVSIMGICTVIDYAAAQLKREVIKSIV
jgi:hypothetical protein